jgi:hypothetical protein
MNSRPKRTDYVHQQVAATLPSSTHPEHTMTSLTRLTAFNAAQNFISSDTAALASHMSHCASKRSRFFGVHAALELAHSVVFTRMVTAAVIAVVLLAITGVV